MTDPVFRCSFCSESLDERDFVFEHIVCWKCGWKAPLPIVKKDSDDQSEDAEVLDWLDDLFEKEYPED